MALWTHDELNNVVYETNDKGEKMLVRSLESRQRAYVRFTNKTKRHIDIWWRNFQGTRMHYIQLRAYTSFDVNTYITHPWEFTDVMSKENYVVENKRIFRAPKEIADKMVRTNWNITIGVRSLRKTCLLKISEYVGCPYLAKKLEIPKVLIKDLQDVITTYGRQATPVGHRNRLTGNEIPPSGKVRLVRVL